MEERLRKDIKKLIIVLLLGLAYFIFVLITGIKIPCPFKTVTGLECAGCGITRMIISAVTFDFEAAFGYNPVLFVTLPIVGGCLIYERIRYVKTGLNEMRPFCKVLLWLEIIILVIYGIIRNFG